MKKLALLAISSLLTLSLVGCGGDNKDTTTTSTSVASQEASAEVTEEATLEATEETQAGGVAEGKFDDFEVVYKGARLGKDYEGKQIVILTLDFTNLAEESKAYMWQVTAKAFQNGIELDNLPISDEINNSNNDKEIKTGITLEVESGFLLQDTTSPIEVEISPLVSFDKDEVYKFEIDPSTLS